MTQINRYFGFTSPGIVNMPALNQYLYKTMGIHSGKSLNFDIKPNISDIGNLEEILNYINYCNENLECLPSLENNACFLPIKDFKPQSISVLSESGWYSLQIFSGYSLSKELNLIPYNKIRNQFPIFNLTMLLRISIWKGLPLFISLGDYSNTEFFWKADGIKALFGNEKIYYKPIEDEFENSPRVEEYLHLDELNSYYLNGTNWYKLTDISRLIGYSPKDHHSILFNHKQEFQDKIKLVQIPTTSVNHSTGALYTSLRKILLISNEGIITMLKYSNQPVACFYRQETRRHLYTNHNRLFFFQ
jgi:prophage antirepressor-like protein